MQRAPAHTSNALLHEVTARDAFGNITSEDYGNSRTTTSAFDSESGRVTSISTSSSSQSLSMVWRSNGILKKRTDTGVTETFSYDGLNRLTQGTSNNTGTDRTLSFGLDDLGNLTSKTSNIAGDVDATGYAYGGTTNAGPHAVSSVTIDGVSHTLYYDANGNVTSIDAASGFDRSFAYNTFNKPTRVTLGNVSTPEAEETFEYGPDGARYLRKSVYDDGGGTITTWTLYLHGGVFEKIVPQSDATIDSIEKTRVSSVAQHTKTDPAMGTATEEMFYFYRDHLGSVNVIADDTGTVLDHLAFDPYGGRRMDDFTADISSTELDQVLDNRNERTGRGFTGHEHLDRTGVIHMNGRIFDPVIGRFLSADPVVQAPTFSQSYNRYAYTFNSPLSFVDPSGYQTGREPLHDGLDMPLCGGQCQAANSLTETLNKRKIARMLHDFYGSIDYFEPGAPGIYGIVTGLLGKNRADELYGFQQGGASFQAEGVARAQKVQDPYGQTPAVAVLADNELIGGFDHLNASVTGDLGIEFFFFVFGASKGSGTTITGEGVCASTTTCGKYGVGMFIGAGFEGSASLSDANAAPGKSIFFRVGYGLGAKGGSISIDDLSTGRVFFGPGAGAAIGIQQCEIVCDE